MTVEEAGEVILLGVKYIKCTECKNSSYSAFRLVCETCGERGVLVNPEYAEACTLLGMTVPEVPNSPVAAATALRSQHGVG